MKVTLTIAWSQTITVEVDENKITSGDADYIAHVQDEAISNAFGNISASDAIILNCPEFNELID